MSQILHKFTFDSKFRTPFFNGEVDVFIYLPCRVNRKDDISLAYLFTKEDMGFTQEEWEDMEGNGIWTVSFTQICNDEVRGIHVRAQMHYDC